MATFQHLLPAGGTTLTAYLTKISGADPLAGGYQLTPADLSGFPSYA